MTKQVWEKSPEKLIQTFYEVMQNFPEAELRKMFGYPCAFLNGNMFVGLHQSNFAVRLSPKNRQEALDQNHGKVFAPMKDRVMKEYVALEDFIINDPNALKQYIEKSFHYAEKLPDKKKVNKTK